MTELSYVNQTTSPEGVVVGAPRRWLGLAAVALLVGALIAYGIVGRSWWLVPVLFLVPDLSMAGYAAGTRLGARLYNLAHTTVLPAATLGVAYWLSEGLVVALSLIWLAHIGLDRALGFGLKYEDRGGHTHLGDAQSRNDRRH
jgi:fatty acid desaturase